MQVKRIVVLLLAVVLILSAFAGCNQETAQSSGGGGQSSKAQDSSGGGDVGGEEKDTSPITLKYLRTTWQTWDEGMDKDPYGQYLIENTGVTLDTELITGDAAEKYNLVLATKDYPDIMEHPGDALLPAYIREGAVVQLDDYLETYRNIYEQFIDGWGVYTNLDDGHIYSIPTWYVGNFVASSATIIRHDIIQEYFPDRADVKSIITVDELYDMLTDYKEKNPKTATGQDFIGWTMVEGSIGLMRQIWGNYGWVYETGADTVELNFFSEKEREMWKYLNKLYREGLLDPDMFLNTQDERNAKLSNESAIVTMGHQAGYSAVNALMHEEDEDKFLAYYRVVSAEGQDGYYAHSPFGGNGTVIMAQGKSVERALQFIDFCCEPMNNFYAASGLPGTFYEVVDGKAVPNIEKLEEIDDLWTRFRQVGAYKYVGWIREGNDERLGDFWNYNVSSLIHYAWEAEQDYSQKHRYMNWGEEDLFNPGYLIGIAVDSASDEGVIKQKIDDIYNRAIPNIIRASSEAEAMQLYDAALDEIRAAGKDQFEAAVAPRYYARKKAIDEM